MVFFCCDGCGETLKKSQVDAHAYRCSSCASVSCVDCNVSFWGDTYRQHTSCMTEAERYEKSVYRGPKKGGNGGNHPKTKKNPQDVWTDLIARASTIATDPVLKSKLAELTCLENVPRKEKQFRNFTANSLKLRDFGGRTTNGDLVDRMWKFLIRTRDAEREKQQSEAKEETKVCVPVPVPLSPTKEVVSVKTQEDAQEQEINTKKLVKAMKKILKKAPKRQLKFKELRGKVKVKLNIIKSTKKELKKTMMEQIRKKCCNEIRIDGKVVSLITAS